MSDWVHRLLELFEGEACEQLWWSWRPGGQLRFSVMCSDTFGWGCADAEEVLAIDLAEARAAKADTAGAADDYEWPTLWCARKRGERPVNAYLKNRSPQMRALMEAAGPEKPSTWIAP